MSSKKNILICGATYGLGFFIANEFLKKDENVIIVGKNHSKMKIAKKKIKSKNAFFYLCDLSNEKKVDLLMRKIKKKHNFIDLVVSNAGKSDMKKTGEENYSEWVRAYRLNFFLHTNIVQSFKKYFKNKKLKKIVMISSVAAYFDGNAPLSYSLAKNSLNNYCKIISGHLADFKININTISPGHILQKNNLWDKKIKKNKAKVFKMINNTVSLKRFCTPEDVFNVINFLLSNKSNYITGTDLRVDGKTS